MLAGTIQTWIKRRIAVRQRLERICTSYLLFLMVVTTKHSIEEAARFSGLHQSLFSKLLKSHSRAAIPAEPPSPVITVSAALAFRKHRCENTP